MSSGPLHNIVVSAFLIIALTLSLGSCAFATRNTEPENLESIPISVNTNTDSFSCPGVPDSSVNTIIDGEAKFQQNIYYQDSWFVRRLECRARAEDYTQSSYMVLAVFGKVPDPSWIPLDEVGAYRGSKEEPFTVEGVEGEGIITLTDNGGGAASFTCGDHYVVTSVFGNSNTVGDVRTNLINLATSMTPWVCQDQPIPGLPGNAPTTLTDLTTTPNSPTPTPPQDPTANSAHSGTQKNES